MTTANKSKKDTMEMLMKRTGEHSIKRKDTIHAALNELRKAEIVTFDAKLLEYRTPTFSNGSTHRNIWGGIYERFREVFPDRDLKAPEAFQKRFFVSRNDVPLELSMSGFADEINHHLKTMRKKLRIPDKYLNGDFPEGNNTHQYEDDVFVSLFGFLTVFQAYQSKYHSNR